MRAVVLEHPRIASRKRFNDIANTPLWSCLMGGYAVSALEREGIDTIFLDHADHGFSFTLTLEKLLELNPDLLCVNSVYFWEHTHALFDFFSHLKSRGYNGHINLFGFFPSMIYRTILAECRSVDSIAVGEFEHTLPELVAALENKAFLDSIEGLASSSCLGDSRSRLRCPETNPDVFAFPRRSSLAGTVSILGSRGCYNHCSFCPVPSFYNQGSLWRGRSPGNIVAEIAELVKQGARSFYFCDPNFIGPGRKGKERLMELMDRIRPMHIRFGMETRPQDLDEEILTALVSAGFESLLMGVESGSSDVLKRIDKHTGPTKATEAITLCRKHGIEPEIGFLMFVPESNLLSLKENLEFLMVNRLLDRLDRTANLLSHSLIVLAGTSGYHRFEGRGKLEKHGLFGFEGSVGFADPLVQWVALLLTHACHTVLRSMGQTDSPIFWQKKETILSRSINNYLITLAYHLLEEASCQNDFSSEKMEERQKEIERGITLLLLS